MHRFLSGRVPLLLSILLAIGLVAGCGDDNPTKPPAPTPIGGNVNKAPIVGASVTVHHLNADGSINPTVVAGPFTTDANGNFSGSPPSGSGPFAMVSTGGTYTDEATGNPVTVPAGRELYGIYQSGSCAVTPLSHATYLAMTDLVDGGASVSAATTQAIATSTTAFGFNFTTTTPSDASGATANQKKYAALLGGLSTLLDANPALSTFSATPKFDLVLALSQDMADGKLDGTDASGNAIQVPTDATGTTFAALPALSATDLSAWLTAANTYAAGVTTLSGIVFNVNTVWNPSATGGGGGSSGTVAFTGTGAAYMPATTATPDTSYNYQRIQWVWKDRARGIEITGVLSSAGGNSIQTLYVVSTSPSHVWNNSTFNDLTGISVSNGTVTFTNCVVHDLSGGTGDMTLNGSLDIPTTINYGTVVYSTSGTSFPAGSTTPTTGSVLSAGTWSWMDAANQIEIRIVLADQTLYPGKAQTVFFIYNSGALLWTAHGVGGVAGVDISGTTTTFTSVVLVDLAVGNTSVTMDGMLTNP